ncbi:MAG: C4-type zinc ribbon domain-containing protein [Trueperaceae bacterium]
MLNRLAEVQTLDLELDALAQERGQVPTELLEAMEYRRGLERSIEVRSQELDELRRAVNANELELKSMEERRRSAAANAVRASSPKEASQFQNQELQFGTRVQELEEDTLPLMESFDQLSETVGGLKAELSELLPQLDALDQAEQERVAGVDQKMDEVRGRRDGLASSIDAALLKQYDQVRKSRRGVGLAEVVDNATCSGCSVRLPIHVVQKARKGAGVTRCPSCGRILMYQS